MKLIIRYIEALSRHISGNLAGLLVFIMMSIVMVEVITRYVVHFPLTIADEFGGYLLVAVTFLGLAFTWKERGHIRITFVVDKLSGRVNKWLRLISLTIALLLVTVLIYASFEFVSYSYTMGIRSFGLRVPMVWPHLVLIIGTSILLLQLFAEFIKLIRNHKQFKGE